MHRFWQEELMSNKPPSRSTLAEIARAAGVSKMAVSKALRDEPDISKSTKERIRALAKQQGYLPNLIARDLVSRSSNLIGAIVPQLTDSTFAETLAGLTEVVEQSGRQLLIAESHYRQAAEAEQVRAMIGRQIEGLVLFSSEHEDIVADLIAKTETRAVEVWDLPATPLGGVSGFDNQSVGTMAADHFHDRGFRVVAFAGHDFYRSRLRWTGFKSAAQRRELQFEHIMLGASGARHYDTYAEGEKLGLLLARMRTLRAIFIDDEIVALTALKVCQEHGRRVPHDLAICGVGNLKLSAFSSPRLTTIDVSAREMGTVAGKMLIAPSAECLPVVRHDVRVVQRETT